MGGLPLHARTSLLVTRARREGARNIFVFFVCGRGRAELELVPGVAGATLGRATLRVPAAAKLVIGVDDTDDARRGATWSTVNEIAFALEQEGACSYLVDRP